MGDRRKQALRTQFDSRLRLDFLGAKVTTDAGLFAFRELDEGFRLTENASVVLSDPRQEHAAHVVGHAAASGLWTSGWV